MEIPGDVFKPALGLVNQTTLAPVGRLIPWKMSRMTMEFAPDKVDTPNNAFPDFMTSIRAKRRCSGTIHNASFDPAFNIFGTNPFALPFFVYEGIAIRMMCVPDSSIVRAAGLAGERMGVPITGAFAELPVAPILSPAYFFLAIRIQRIRHEADAAAGQPFDFEYESISAFAMPGEATDLLTLYGFSPVVGAGGFL